MQGAFPSGQDQGEMARPAWGPSRSCLALSSAHPLDCPPRPAPPRPPQFCYTGRMGLRGNLTPGQIVEQVCRAG